MCLLIGVSYISLIYCFSFLFEDAAVADGVCTLPCTLGSAALQAPFLISTITKSGNLVWLESLFYIVFGPFFALPHGISNVISKAAVSGDVAIFEWDCAGGPLVVLAIDAVLCWALLVHVERLQLMHWSWRASPDVPLQEVQLPEEVRSHQEEVASAQSSAYRVRLANLRKVYPGKGVCCPDGAHNVAVEDLTLGISPGEMPRVRSSTATL